MRSAVPWWPRRTKRAGPVADQLSLRAPLQQHRVMLVRIDLTILPPCLETQMKLNVMPILSESCFHDAIS